MLASGNSLSSAFHRHPPAGRPVPSTSISANTSKLGAFGVRTELFDSGTAALAVALASVAKAANDVTPSVLLPAYACPNLVAASLWAGLPPAYYDISPDSFGPLESSVSGFATQRSAIVIVDAFGARSLALSLGRVPQLQHHRNQLVHDLAQSYAPYEPSWQPEAPRTVMSFGKAKPMSLTFGGALLIPDDYEVSLPTTEVRDPSKIEFSLRAAVYKQSLGPRVFGLLSRVPGLGIGKTTFSRLQSVARLSEHWHTALDAAVAHTRSSLGDIQRASDHMIELALRAGAKLPHVAIESLGRLPLWRVPVLCSNPRAAQLLSERGGHLGISRLYERSLPELLGATREDAEAQWPNAVSVAERLITLPTHGRLSHHELRRLEGLLSEVS